MSKGREYRGEERSATKALRHKEDDLLFLVALSLGGKIQMPGSNVEVRRKDKISHEVTETRRR